MKGRESQGSRPFEFLGGREGAFAVRPPIHQALAHGAGHDLLRALAIIDAEFDAVAVAKIELGNVTVQMLFSAMLVDALHAALEYAVEALGGVGVHVATAVLAPAVANEIML